MILRTFSTVGLWLALSVAVAFFGLPAGVWLLAICVTLAERELLRMLHQTQRKPWDLLVLTTAPVLILCGYYGPLLPSSPSPLEAGATVFMLVAGAAALPAIRQYPTVPLDRTYLPTLFCLILVPFPLLFFVAIAALPSPAWEQFANLENGLGGLFLALWVVVAAKFNDVMALLIGSLIGRHPLAPNVSPKKTWEGFFGGLIGAALFGALFVFFFKRYFPPVFTPLLAALGAIPVALAGTVSDLLESVLKREAGRKDSGGLIPGIGGFFDLLDSLTMAAPVGYVVLRLILA